MPQCTGPDGDAEKMHCTYINIQFHNCIQLIWPGACKIPIFFGEKNIPCRRIGLLTGLLSGAQERGSSAFHLDVGGWGSTRAHMADQPNFNNGPWWRGSAISSAPELETSIVSLRSCIAHWACAFSLWGSSVSSICSHTIAEWSGVGVWPSFKHRTKSEIRLTNPSIISINNTMKNESDPEHYMISIAWMNHNSRFEYLYLKSQVEIRLWNSRLESKLEIPGWNPGLKSWVQFRIYWNPGLKCKVRIHRWKSWVEIPWLNAGLDFRLELQKWMECLMNYGTYEECWTHLDSWFLTISRSWT